MEGPSSIPNTLIPGPDAGHSLATTPLLPTASSPSGPSSSSTHSSRSKAPSSIALPPAQLCASCERPVTGQFVRALGAVYHLDCFTCQDCGRIVAAKFFPVDGPLGLYPLCERDYFKRLNLLCASCGEALRGSYITALEKKFHVEHFTCSVCPAAFGPQDSYYEHDGAVYCHFHYSTRFAVKCSGCQIAILKQFVEINRYDNDEHWHPECYMINKFWNTKLAPTPPMPKRKPSGDIADSNSPTSPSDAQEKTLAQKQAEALEKAKAHEAVYLRQECQETAVTLRNKQKWMEEKVYRIWTVLSTFEESAAACISEMLRFVSNGQYLEGVRMAEKFVLHVETLFAATDDLNALFRYAGDKEMSHMREARMLCKKIVNFFSLLSHTHEAGSRKMGISQELLSLVTGLAHYLKLLIRIALGGALKLEREHQNHSAIHQFLTRLDQLARDPEAAKATFTLPSQPEQSDQGHSSASSPTSSAEQPPVYGYQSLSRAVGTLIGQGEATSDLCEACKGSVEEECVRFGTSLRWHFACLKCVSCNASAGRKESASSQPTPEPASQVYPPSHFRFEPKPSTSHESNGVTGRQSSKSGRVICVDCVSKTRALETKEGFAHVTRLEQYAFLLCVALNKLYGLLKSKGVMQPSASGKSSIPEGLQEETRSLYETYRDSAEIKRMKSVNLDRKLSATVRTPKKSTVIDGPAGKSGQVLADQKEKVPSTLPRASSENLTRTQPQPLSLPTNTRDRSATVAAQSLPQEGKPPRPPPLDPQKAAAYGLTPVERPAYNRSQSAVRVVDDDDTPLAQHREDLKLKEAARNDQDGLTLADLPHAMAHEQALKEQQRQDGRKQKPVSPRHAQFLSELSALEYMLVKHAATLMLPAEDSPFRDIASQEELVDLVEMRKNNFWSKFFKPQDNKKSVKKKGVFGIPLEFLVEREGVESMLGAGAAPLRVPTFVDEVVSAMKQMDMSVEGVFRKNGNIRRLKDLSEALDKDPSSVNLVDENPVQLAALLKKYLRELPEPLFPFKMHHMFVASQNIENKESRLRVLHLLCCLLPKAHRDTIEVLFVFLKWVATFSHVDEESGSKMDILNLATVICPNIMYSKGKDPTTDNSFAAIRTLQDLMENQDRLWHVPAEVAPILDNPDLFSNPELTTKDILRTCREILNSGRGKGRTNGQVATSSHPGAAAHHPDYHHPAPQLPGPYLSYDRAGRPYGASPVGSPADERPKSFQFFPPGGIGNSRPNSPMASQQQQQQQQQHHQSPQQRHY